MCGGQSILIWSLPGRAGFGTLFLKTVLAIYKIPVSQNWYFQVPVLGELNVNGINVKGGSSR